MLDKYLQIVAHHKWIVVSLVAGLITLEGWHKWIAHADLVDHDQAVIARAKVDADTKTASAAQQQVQQLQQQISQQAVANAVLRQEVLNAIATRNTQTEQRKQIESTAPLADITRRWAEIIGADSNAVRPDAGGGAAVTDSASRATVQKLEDGSAAQANYSDLSKLDAGKDEQIKGLNTLVASEEASAKAQQVLLADQVTACKSDLKVAADEGKKKGRRGFWRGLATGVGIVGAIALRFL